MDIQLNAHFVNLNQEYNKVANNTVKNQDLLVDNLKVSRDLFTPSSITARKPEPKDLEVYALLSGLSFEAQLTEKLVQVQDTISGIIEDTLHYWVKSDNFGVEYCVYKWPWQNWDDSLLPLIRGQLSILEANPFNFFIKGIQLNPDGCLVAKGFDEGAQIFSIRNQIKDGFPLLPKRQSSWAHIPIGRILEPLGESKFSELMRYVHSTSEQLIASQKITSLKLIHETQWYMEKHRVVDQYTIN